MPPDELVLCTPRNAVPPPWLPPCGAVPLSSENLAQALTLLPPVWLPRSYAEQDPSHKQWIPYGMLRSPSGHLACYPRQGSEARLHGLRSIGVGGHVNPGDAPDPFNWLATLRQGFARELAEEFPAAVSGRTHLLGLINEDDTPVGCVHFGVVFLHQLKGEPPPPEGELSGLVWFEPSALPLDSLETWSRLACSLLPPALSD